MMGEQLKLMWKRLTNVRGEAATNAPATYTPEIQEKLARLDKLEKDNKSLGYRLRSHERIVKELGDAVEYDENGNPLSLRAQQEAAVRPVASAFVNGHPLSALGLENPQSVDEYYSNLIAQKGYLTRAEAEKLADARAQMYAGTVMGNARVWRNYDKLTVNEKYKALADMKSDLSTRTARILQERGFGQPMSEEAKGFDEWRYRDIGDLQFAADLARIEAQEQGAVAAASTASAAEAQAAAGLTAVPAGTGGAAAGNGKPDFAAMGSASEVLDALEKASPPGPPN